MDVNQNIFNTKDSIKGLVDVDKNELFRYDVKPNDLFFTRTSETSEEIGLTSAYTGELIDCVFSGFILRARPLKDNINSLFFAYYLRSDKSRNNIIKYSSITTRALISGTNLYKMKVKMPNLDEQNKIASFLSTIDKKIELLEKKLSLYQKFNEGLKEQMFANISIKKHIKLKTFLKESKIPNDDDITKRLTVKLNLKGITKREIKSMEKEGATTQYLRKKGQFIYGKQNLHKGAFGIIPKELDGYLSSSDIPSFDFIDNSINPLWFYYYFSRKRFYESLEKFSTGTGSKRISPNEFLNIKIPLLSLDQQNNEVNLFNKLNKKEKIINNEIKNLKELKKGLLQKMFV